MLVRPVIRVCLTSFAVYDAESQDRLVPGAADRRERTNCKWVPSSPRELFVIGESDTNAYGESLLKPSTVSIIDTHHTIHRTRSRAILSDLEHIAALAHQYFREVPDVS